MVVVVHAVVSSVVSIAASRAVVGAVTGAAGSEGTGARNAEGTVRCRAATAEAFFADVELHAIEFSTVEHACALSDKALCKGPEAERTDGVLSVANGVEDDRADAGSDAILVELDVGANDAAGLTEEVLEVLPSDFVVELCAGFNDPRSAQAEARTPCTTSARPASR